MTNRKCEGTGCDRPCRGVSNCRLHTIRATRAHYLPKIARLLSAGPASLSAIATTLDLRPDVTAVYLRHMHRDLRTARPVMLASADLWELGEDPLLPSADADQDQRSVPARQVGMQRDPLVAVLFGPAREVAAC